MIFNRKVYFDSVRKSLFQGTMEQQQVDGQEALLSVWEVHYPTLDLRWLAYALATTLHETASTMWPIEEYGKGAGMEYGKVDPQTGQIYYGRGFCQLTWRDNYARADKELNLKGIFACEWHAANQLKPRVAAATLFIGMMDGWFRTSDGKPENLERYFNAGVDDPFNAREIINGDKHTVPGWSDGVSIGNLIKDYHAKFLSALCASVKGNKPA